ESALEVVGDGGEMDLGGGFGDASPSHPAQAVTAFPRAEDFLDSAANAMDRLVPGLEPGLCLLLGASPNTGGDNPRRPALGADGAAEMRSAIGAVGKDLTGIVGQGSGTGTPIVHIGWSDRNLLDQRRV